MFFFEGCSCPVCGKKFKSDDDVVACPQCGAPHHRECYKSNGGCAFEAAHSEGYVWSNERSDGSEQQKGIVCPECGAESPQGRLYCVGCGRALYEQRFSDGSRDAQGDSAFFSFGSDEAAISDNELVEDVPVGDLKRFVGTSSYYYVPIFLMFARAYRKVSFNFLAFLTHGLWFISRKMYVIGGALLAAQLASFTFQSYCAVQLKDIMELYYGGNMNSFYAEFSEMMMSRPALIFGLFASSLLHYGILIFSGLFGNRVYMSFCVRRIKKLNGESATAEQFNSLLEARGGVAAALAVGCCVLYFALRLFLQSKFGV